MTQAPAPRMPTTGEHGIASSGIEEVASRVTSAWDALCLSAERVDLEVPANHDAYVALGVWPDNRNIGDILAQARDHERPDHGDLATLAKRIADTHADATPEAVRASVYAQRDQVYAAFDVLGSGSYGLALVDTQLGALPLLTYLHATVYAIGCAFVHSGDTNDPETVDAGVVALLDTIGALAVREQTPAAIATVTPTMRAAMRAADDGWTVAVDPAELDDTLATVRADSDVLLAITIGRADIAGALRRGELGVTNPRGLLGLVPIVESVPSLPGRSAVLAAVRTADVVTGIWERLRGWSR